MQSTEEKEVLSQTPTLAMENSQKELEQKTQSSIESSTSTLPTVKKPKNIFISMKANQRPKSQKEQQIEKEFEIQKALIEKEPPIDEKLLKRKRGRINRIDKLRNEKNKILPIHSKYNPDNIKRKIKTHYHNFIIGFLNMKIKQEWGNQSFKFRKLESKITQDIRIRANKILLNQPLKTVLKNVSKKFKDTNANTKFIESISLDKPEIRNILNKTYKDFYITYYLTSTKDTFKGDVDESFERHLEMIKEKEGNEYMEKYKENALDFINFFLLCKERKRLKNKDNLSDQFATTSKDSSGNEISDEIDLNKGLLDINLFDNDFKEFNINNEKNDYNMLMNEIKNCQNENGTNDNKSGTNNSTKYQKVKEYLQKAKNINLNNENIGIKSEKINFSPIENFNLINPLNFFNPINPIIPFEVLKQQYLCPHCRCLNCGNNYINENATSYVLCPIPINLNMNNNNNMNMNNLNFWQNFAMNGNNNLNNTQNNNNNYNLNNSNGTNCQNKIQANTIIIHNENCKD